MFQATPSQVTKFPSHNKKAMVKDKSILKTVNGSFVSSSLSNDTLVVIDSRVKDLEFLIAEIKPRTQLLVLHPQLDGVSQITEALATHPNISSLHLISHGSSGCLYLGNSQLNLETIAKHSSQLKLWSEVLQQKDVLIYGCEVAQGPMGHLFLQQLHQLTGANLAASEAKVGYTSGNSNWDLEAYFGEVRTDIIFSNYLQANYRGHFAEVSFDITTDLAIETNEDQVTLNFTLDEAPPPEGTVVVLSANESASINRFDLGGFSGDGLELVGIAPNPLFFDVSPNMDFGAFAVNIREQNASITVTLLETPTDEDLNGDGTIEDFANIAEDITWTISEIAPGDVPAGLGTPGTINPTADSDNIIIADNPSQLPSPTVGMTVSENLLIEDEGSETTITFTLDQPAPTGGLLVSISNKASFFPLADFDVAPPPPQASAVNATIGQGFQNNDGLTIRINEGVTTASLTLPIFNDGDEPDPNDPTKRNDDIGIEPQTWTLDPQVAIDEGLEVGDYQVDPNAGTFDLTILDTRGQLNPPDAIEDNFSIDEGVFLNGNVLSANPTIPDSDSDGDSLTVTAINDNDANVGTQITLASGALLTLNSDGTFEYDQNGAFDDLEQGQTDTDSFTYTITDGQEVSPSDSAPSPPPGFGIADPRVFNEDSTTVNITINGTAPQLPVAEDDSANTDEKNQVEIDVLANDTDTSGTGISVTSLDNTGLLGQISTDGTTVTYDPNGQFDSLPLGGQDSEIFSYTITDGNGEIDSAVVTVTIDGVNDPPVAVDDDEQTQQEVGVSVDVLANDSDIDQGDVLSIDSFTTPGNGSVQEVEGELLYTPNADFFGTDTFTYTVTDSNGGFATATVTVEVEPPPFVPEFGSIDGETIEVEGSRKLVFAGGGNDLVDSSVSEGENRIYLQSGEDIAILGQGDRILGGVGDCLLYTSPSPRDQ